MSWRDSQRFMKIAATIRGAGWVVAAVALVFGAFAVLDSEGEDALSVMRFVALILAISIGATHAMSWFIEKHAERVVVR
jgi:hypothetical protein